MSDLPPPNLPKLPDGYYWEIEYGPYDVDVYDIGEPVKCNGYMVRLRSFSDDTLSDDTLSYYTLAEHFIKFSILDIYREDAEKVYEARTMIRKSAESMYVETFPQLVKIPFVGTYPEVDNV